MDITSLQIKNRLADVDWKLAGVDGLDSIVGPLLDETKAEAEFDARSRVNQAWSLSGFAVSMFSLVSNGRPWGMSGALAFLCAAMIIASVRSYRSRKALERSREAAYQAVDDLADQHPRPQTAHCEAQE